MASLTIEFPSDESLQMIVAALCRNNAYRPADHGTPEAFAVACLKEWVGEQVRIFFKSEAARKTAELAAATDQQLAALGGAIKVFIDGTAVVAPEPEPEVPVENDGGG